MRYAEYRPSPGLAGLVERFWVLEGVASGVPDAIFPDGRVEIVFHYGGTFWRHGGDASRAVAASRAGDAARGGDAAPERQPDAMVVGQMLAPVRLAPEGRAGVAAVRLRPAAARSLVGFSLDEIAGRFVDLDQLFPSAARMRERLAEATSDTRRIALLEEWLTRHVRVRGEGDVRVDAVARAIEASGGRASIEALARTMGLHVRQLERLFLQEVGLTPKTFARIRRLQGALRRIRDGAPLSAAAVDCGYYDQAHMALDFRRLASMSPRAWQKHAGELAPLFVTGGR
jgi:AraC-like DNA-binding protein